VLSLLGELLICLSYYSFMMIFMATAIGLAKRKSAWVWYAVGAGPQLLSGLFLGNWDLTGSVGNNIFYWAVYFGIVIATAILIVWRKKKGKQ